MALHIPAVVLCLCLEVASWCLATTTTPVKPYADGSYLTAEFSSYLKRPRMVTAPYRNLQQATVTGLDLISIVVRGDVSAVRKALVEGADPNYQSRDGYGALTIAIHFDFGDIVSLLIGAGADPKQATAGLLCDYGALQWACQSGSPSAATALLAAGVSVDDLNDLGMSALEYCVEVQDIPTATVLLDADANIDLAGKDIFVPLFSAATKGDLEMVKLLIDRGADVDKKSGPRDETPIFGAVVANSPAIIKELLAKGANIDAQGSDSETPIWYAAFYGQKAALNVLVNKGADKTIKSKGNTPRENLCACIKMVYPDPVCNYKACSKPRKLVALLN